MTLVSQVAAHTFEAVGPKIHDNFSNNNAFVHYLRKMGNATTDESGGTEIRKNLTYAENGSYDRYSKRERVNIQENDILTVAKYPYRQVSVALVMDGLEQDVQNIGKPKLVSLLKAKTDVVEMTYENNFEVDLMSDGTASGGRQVNGIQALMADSPAIGTVGMIDASLYPWWRNVAFDCTTDGGGAMSSTNVKAFMDQAWKLVKRGSDKPDFYMADDNYYGFYESYLSNIQRIESKTGGGTAGTGWDELTYKGKPFVLAGGQGGAIPTNHIYGVNLRHFELMEAKNRKFKPRPAVTSIDQDMEVTLFLWAGNLCCGNRAVQLVIKD